MSTELVEGTEAGGEPVPGARLGLGRPVLRIPSASGCTDLHPSAVASATCVRTQPQRPFPGIPGAPVICKTNKSSAQLPLLGCTDSQGAPPHPCTALLQTGWLGSSPGAVSRRLSTFVLHTPHAGRLLPAKRQANENSRINARKMTIPTPPGKEAFNSPTSGRGVGAKCF